MLKTTPMYMHMHKLNNSKAVCVSRETTVPSFTLHVHMLDHDLLYAAEAHLFRQPRVIAWWTNVRPLHSTSQ